MGLTLDSREGFLQGQDGLIGDQVVSYTLILANGTLTIVSAESNPDLLSRQWDVGDLWQHHRKSLNQGR